MSPCKSIGDFELEFFSCLKTRSPVVAQEQSNYFSWDTLSMILKKWRADRSQDTFNWFNSKTLTWPSKDPVNSRKESWSPGAIELPGAAIARDVTVFWWLPDICSCLPPPTISHIFTSVPPAEASKPPDGKKITSSSGLPCCGPNSKHQKRKLWWEVNNTRQDSHIFDDSNSRYLPPTSFTTALDIPSSLL